MKNKTHQKSGESYLKSLQSSCTYMSWSVEKSILCIKDRTGPVIHCKWPSIKCLGTHIAAGSRSGCRERVALDLYSSFKIYSHTHTHTLAFPFKEKGPSFSLGIDCERVMLCVYSNTSNSFNSVYFWGKKNSKTSSPTFKSLKTVPCK